MQSEGMCKKRARDVDLAEFDCAMATVDLTPDSHLLVGKLPFSVSPEEIKAIWQLKPEFRGEVMMYGKLIAIPRCQQSYLRDYKFSGVSHAALELPVELEPFLKLVNSLELGEFNHALANWYENGHDYIGSHADSEKQLVKGSPVVTISLGATRTFRVRQQGKIVQDFPADHGSVLVMCGEFQKELKHEIPKTMKVHSRRVSLTFRQFY